MPRMHRDLCSTCFHAPKCMHLRSTDRPVFECEEFSQEGAPLPWSLEGNPLPAFSRQGSAERSEGLCSDCENRKHCAARALDGGVWHCEEYR